MYHLVLNWHELKPHGLDKEATPCCGGPALDTCVSLCSWAGAGQLQVPEPASQRTFDGQYTFVNQQTTEQLLVSCWEAWAKTTLRHQMINVSDFYIESSSTSLTSGSESMIDFSLSSKVKATYLFLSYLHALYGLMWCCQIFNVQRCPAGFALITLFLQWLAYEVWLR